MGKGVIITIVVSVVVILLVVGAVGFFFYNKYSEEIGEIQKLREEAKVLFDQGIVGPNECASFTSCVSYCNSNKNLCVDFCKNNSENGLCELVGGFVEDDNINLEDYVNDTEKSEDNGELIDEDPIEESEEDEGGDEILEEDLTPEELCVEDLHARGFDHYLFAEEDLTAEICSDLAVLGCEASGKIVVEDIFVEDLFCCEWSCTEPLEEPLPPEEEVEYYCKWVWPQKIINKDTAEILWPCSNDYPYCFSGYSQCCSDAGHTDCIEMDIGGGEDPVPDPEVVDCNSECLAGLGMFSSYIELGELIPEHTCEMYGTDWCLAEVGEVAVRNTETVNCCCFECGSGLD
jgi:hypothetical protein